MESGIQLIVGLGNPGPQYENTRHNVGLWLLQSLAEKHATNFKVESKFKGAVAEITIAEHLCKLLWPTTFMNLSGQAVSALANFYKISPSSILVVHDELDFPPGIARLKRGGGANGHNGVQNIIDLLGVKDFYRLRIGIGKPNEFIDPSGYVLQKIPVDQKRQIISAVDFAVAIIPELVLGNFDKAVQDLHSKCK